MLRSISQKESLEWQSRGAFRALAVSAAANLSHKLRHLRRISATQHKVLTFAAACLSQKLSLLCLIKMFVSHLAVSQHDTGQTMWGVHPPSSSRRMLPQFDDFGKQRSVYARGVAGGGEGGQTCKNVSLSSNLNLVPHT